MAARYTLVLALVLSACARASGPATPADTVEEAPAASGSVSVAVGETRQLGNLKVTFTGVDGDNRCPKEVVCIVGGQATVLLTVAGPDSAGTDLRIVVPPDATASARYGDGELTVDLEPEAKAGEAIESGSYVVTVEWVRGFGVGGGRRD